MRAGTRVTTLSSGNGMDDERGSLLALGLLLLGFLLIGTRNAASRKLAALYRKMGIDVPVEQYAKQFLFVAVLLIIFGFLAATGLVRFL
jgi:hypothetical protein